MKQADLLKRIEELERRVQMLEARPVYVPVYVPNTPSYPTYPTIPFTPYTVTTSTGEYSNGGFKWIRQ